MRIEAKFAILPNLNKQVTKIYKIIKKYEIIRKLKLQQ